MIEQRNVILAVVLSIAILLGFQYFFVKPREDARVQQTAQQQTVPAVQPPASAPGAVPGAAPTVTAPTAAAPAAGQSRAEIIAGTPRVRINTPSLHGSIALIGGRIDDLTLVRYHETVSPKSPEIVLLSPPGAAEPYYADFGWVAAQQGTAVPGPETRWTADRDTLTPDQPVTLTWNNGQGLVFRRIISIDRNYLFTVRQTVENTSGQPVTLYPYGLISRSGTPKTEGFYILHEGLIGVVNGTLREVDYDDVRKENKIEETTTGGWLGITDKYWLTTLIPDQQVPVSARFSHRIEGDVNKYQTDVLASATVVQPGETADVGMRLFAGAKEISLLDQYAEQYGIPNFDKAVDFGWFYFLTKPIFLLLNLIHGVVGNFGVAILVLTVIIKGLFFPLANKSYKAMSKMKKLQPEMKKLQERFKGDPTRLQQEMMALYKREKANPVSGCLPILIQIPVFFALYKVLFVSIEMRHAPFFGWVQDLSAPDPTTVFNLFGLIPWTPPEFLPLLGVWPLIMGITMWLQQRLNPAPPDPIQAKMFMFMPVIFTFLLASFPAGLVIYWAWNNVLSIAQQWLIMRRMGVKV